jgi:threonine dehydratase
MSDQLVSIAEIRTAAVRIARIAIKTPLIRAQFPGLSGYGTTKEIYLKAESLQPIGAFKLRGAANKILQLTPDEVARGVITYSSEPCAGCGLCGARGGGEGGDRDAAERSADQARGNAGHGR